ncbi:contractile injection system tape measure protein [Fulvivirga sediminis]|uniref:Uncharacterized protein n=1 Tax=Fulvivirga sediminis TaxID=2803949 RepID=A0A937F394_9BACT|nr:contractile injection system tape measure protein [Fulvivirga sediminis]MBL3655532.1 hypothetical protein [Fulvivirga sediminis]
MTSQKHIINKQIIEIHLSDRASSTDMQNKVSKLFHDKLMPILNKYCDNISADGGQYRIDELNLDLGKVSLAELETAFDEKLKEVLEHDEAVILKSDLVELERGKERPLETLFYFLMTGILPWWVQAQSREYLHHILNDLLINANAEVKSAIRRVGQDAEFSKRFLNTFSADQVTRCIELLMGHMPPSVAKAKEKLAILLKNSDGFEPAQWNKTFFGIVYNEVSTHGKVNSEEILIYKTIKTIGNIPLPDHLLPQGERRQKQHLIQDLQAAINNIKGLYQENQQWAAVFNQLADLINQPLFITFSQAQMESLLTYVHMLKNLRVEKQGAYQQVVEATIRPIAQRINEFRNQLKQKQPEVAVIEKVKNNFNKTDFIGVTNAGLVILWPFLIRLFENLHLLKERKFRNENAQQKSAAVLQYLVDADPTAFEGLLALNKVLCGLSLAAPLSIEPLADEEKELCDHMLKAVISRGPYWKNLKLLSFRTSYLQREGILSTKDGHWLLQVKKETYDITLEKLPWGFNTVKLPWMNEILLVEWL